MKPNYLNRSVSTASRFFSVYPPNFQVKDTPVLSMSSP